MGSLLAYDTSGAVIGTLEWLMVPKDEGYVLVDFEASANAGIRLRELWEVAGAMGSGYWPEYLGGAAHDYDVRLSGGQITSLVHRRNGSRRDLLTIQAAIAATPIRDGARDIRAIVGGPDRPVRPDAPELR
jgi:hypothetical protein